ncbi:tetratricopeptide repeat protein [Nostoc sp. CHAB 5834]|nr:tetratricopeptide repeat protein [Nostoc sp. CHAB 5834]
MNDTPQSPAQSSNVSVDNNTSATTNLQQPELKVRSSSLLKRLLVFLTETEPSVSWIGGLIALIGVGLVVMNQIDTKVKEVFLDKLGPYENLQAGKALIDDFEYDAAIPDLEIAFKKLGIRFSQENVRSERYYPIVDYYLYAIINSRYPALHQHRFKEILKLEEDNKISFNSWHFHQFAWYYFRTGSLEKANEYFLKAINNFKVQGDPNSAADSYWGLSLVDLCKGNLDSAMKNYEEAYQIKSFYSPESVLRTIKLMEKDYWYEKIIDQYDIEKYLPEFSKKIQAVKPQGEVIRGSNPEGYGSGLGK